MGIALQLMDSVLRCFFGSGDTSSLPQLLTDDFYAFGLSEGQVIQGRHQVAGYLANPDHQAYRALELQVGTRQELPASHALIEFSLTAKGITVRMRMLGAACQTDQGPKLSLLSFSLIDPRQTKDMFQQLAAAKAEDERLRFLDGTFPGGMMGGFEEPGWPLYFINQPMLDFLGYECEADFRAATDGLVANCIHPADRQRVAQEVDSQLEAADTYKVDYRMLSHDDGYRWVHDVGRRTVTEDGRRAIISACYDITEDKRRRRFVEGLAKGLSADVATFALDRAGKRAIPEQLSRDMGSKLALDPSQFLARYGTNALACVFPPDRDRLWESLLHIADDNDLGTVTFRVINAQGEPLWLNASFACYGERDGMPLLQALFTSVSMQQDLQLQALSAGNVGVYVMDAGTDELLYANDAAFALHGVEPCDTLGRTCHQVFFSCEDRCKMCWLSNPSALDGSSVTFEDGRGSTLLITVEQRQWAGRDILVVSAADITPEVALRQDLLDARNATAIALEYGNLGLWTYDLDTRCLQQKYGESSLYATPAVVQDIPDSFVANGQIHPADAEAYLACYHSILDDAPQASCVVRVRYRETREYRWARIYLVRQEQAPGSPRRAIGFSIDVDAEVRNVQQAEQARERLRESQEVMLAACRFAKMWTFKYDMAAKAAYPDAALQDLFGLPAKLEAFPQSTLAYGIILPEFKDEYLQAFRALQEGAASVDFEAQVRFPDRMVHWAHFRGEVLAAEDGNATAAISVQLIDKEMAVRSRANLERSRMKSEDGELLLSYSADIVEDAMLEFRGTPATDAGAIEVMGYTGFTQACLGLIRHQDDKRRHSAAHDPASLYELYASGQDRREGEFQIVAPDGRDIWVRALMHLVRDPATGHLLLFEYVYDISTEKLIEELLRVVVSQRFESVGCLDLDDGQYLRLEIDEQSGRPVARRVDYQATVDGYASAKLDPASQQRYRANCTLDAMARNAREGRTFVHKETENGQEHYKRCSSHLASNGRLCILTRSDVTPIVQAEEQERARLEEALEKAERATQAKTDFLARMSHDIRTPLNAIIGLSALTLDDATDPAAVRENMANLRSSGDFLLSLVNDILDSAKLEEDAVALHPAPYAYNEFLAAMRTMFKPQCDAKGIQLTFQQPTTNPVIMVDKARLTQVFFNVFSNAVKYTERGGTIAYSARNLDIRDGMLSVDYVVADTGVGMTQEYQQRLFKPFEQECTDVTPELQGSGLGLSITKSLVELMGGTIAVESAKGQGTTVTISLTLPCVSADVAEQAPKGAAPIAGSILEGREVLLAEDHPLNAAIARQLLERKGMRVQHAQNGQVAVDMFGASEPGQFDAVLMDIRMPLLSGLDAARAIRSLDRDDARTVAIIALSANAYPEDVQKSLDAGMDAHLPKPIDPPALYELLEDTLATAPEA